MTPAPRRDTGRVIVVGSINVDVVARAERIPRPGETVGGRTAGIFPGGKGANQAVAAHRLGARVLLCGAVGSDEFGRVPLAFFDQERLEHRVVEQAGVATGLALIVVDDTGENAITVVPGANDHVWNPPPAVAFSHHDVVLLQNEIPAAANAAVIAGARATGARWILNVAPYRTLSPDVLEDTAGLLVVNEVEFAHLAALPPGDVSAQSVRDILDSSSMPAAGVVVTLGAAGVVARIGGSVYSAEGWDVRVADSTGAGDCFCGAFAACLAGGASVAAAMDFGNAAAALSVQKQGAAPSMPVGREVEEFMRGARAGGV